MNKYQLQRFANEVSEFMMDWINNNLTPDEVFSEQELKDWAENSGYIKEEKCPNKKP